MSGTVKQFVDFSNNTNSDTGENSAASIVPFTNGESVVASVLNRPGESIRQRTEALRSVEEDTLYLRDADRGLILTGPGKISWAGSTTAAADGIVHTSDTLYLIPMLTPGPSAPVSPPVPPVASVYGVLHLLRASDNMESVVVTSQRRSYARGDQISVTVTSGASFSCTLAAAAAGYERTINIVATPTTTLSDIITALNALTPTAPDNTPLVTAALENGALGPDLVLAPQAKQFVAGNYDGEAHAITMMDLSAFFSTPANCLAEGDTLCIRYNMVTDPASTGGRRQSTPENGNTALPSGSFFNSRVNPEYLVNALPVCKVVNNYLVFATGAEIPPGATNYGIASAEASSVGYAGGPAWADATANPATTVENQLDKIVSDLAGATGTAKIYGAAVGSEIAAGTLSAQISSVASDWLKLSRNNTVSGSNTFTAVQSFKGSYQSLFGATYQVDREGIVSSNYAHFIDDFFSLNKGAAYDWDATTSGPGTPTVSRVGHSAHVNVPSSLGSSNSAVLFSNNSWTTWPNDQIWRARVNLSSIGGASGSKIVFGLADDTVPTNWVARFEVDRGTYGDAFIRFIFSDSAWVDAPVVNTGIGSGEFYFILAPDGASSVRWAIAADLVSAVSASGTVTLPSGVAAGNCHTVFQCVQNIGSSGTLSVFVDTVEHLVKRF